METSYYQELVKQASQAAQLAGDRVYAARHEACISVKQGLTGEEMVTQMDKLSQDIVIDTLRSHFPGHGFIGEEGEAGRIFKQAPQGAERIWWIIDPIDGTNNFARGLDLYAVSIGAMQNGIPVAGVIYNPSTRSLFCAAQGGPALLNGQSIEVSPLELSPFTSVALDSHFGDTVYPWMCEIMVRCRYRSLGSAALHMAYVANGALIGTIISMPKLWDIAAGAALAPSCGAVLTDWEGRDLWPLDLDNYEGGLLPCIMAGPTAHREFLELMQKTD